MRILAIAPTSPLPVSNLSIHLLKQYFIPASLLLMTWQHGDFQVSNNASKLGKYCSLCEPSEQEASNG
jgi:hypothetical protein